MYLICGRILGACIWEWLSFLCTREKLEEYGADEWNPLCTRACSCYSGVETLEDMLQERSYGERRQQGEPTNRSMDEGNFGYHKRDIDTYCIVCI